MRRALALALLAACGGDDVVDVEEPRNVVLVVVDTLRADEVTPELMPRLDGFATGRALRFTSAYATAPWTKPSVASLLTGLDPRAHGVTLHFDPLHSRHRTLAEAFAEAGYATHAVQSNLLLHGVFGFDQGFVRYEAEPGETLATHDVSTGGKVNAAAFVWLDARDASVPFFLWVHHYEPHHEYLRLDADLLPPELELDPARRALLAAATMDQLIGNLEQLTPDEVRYVRARYRSDVRHQDELLGELFDGLDERGLLASSLVVVTADHGEEFMEHGSLSHLDDKLFDELTRVPLLLAGPGVAVGTRDEPVSLADAGRTLLDLAGLDHADFPGRSLLGEPRAVVAHGRRTEEHAGREAIVGDVDGERFKLIVDLDAGSRTLFALADDPGEARDLAEERPEVAAALEERLAAHRAAESLPAKGTPEPVPADTPEIEARRARFLEDNAGEIRKLGYLGGD